MVTASARTNGLGYTISGMDYDIQSLKIDKTAFEQEVNSFSFPRRIEERCKLVRLLGVDRYDMLARRILDDGFSTEEQCAVYHGTKNNQITVIECGGKQYLKRGCRIFVRNKGE